MNPTEGLSASPRPEGVPPGLPGLPQRRPRAGSAWGQRGGGRGGARGRGGSGLPRRLRLPGPLRHRPKARAGRRGRGRGAAGSPGLLTESRGPDFPAAVAAPNLRPTPSLRVARGRRGAAAAVPARAPAPSARGPRRRPGKRAGAGSGAALPARGARLAASAVKRRFLGPGLGRSGSPPSWPRRRASRFPREEKELAPRQPPRLLSTPAARPTRPIAQFLPWNCRVTRTEPRNVSQVASAGRGAAGFPTLTPGAL